MGRRETKKEATKGRILDVSLQLFQKQGFARTTMRDIARKSGIALGTTYNYFPTKDHLAGYFFERALDEVMERYRRTQPKDASLEEKLFFLISIELEQIAPYEEFLHLIVTHAILPTSRLHPASRDSQRLKHRYLDFVGGILEGRLETFGSGAMILDAFWVFHLGILMFWMNDASRKKEDTFILLDKSLRFILSALQGKGEAPSRRKR
ncbi:MAG TPA: TetR/AcrR family transcriptional regulator [Planctomycetota bacterium]|nr:TetR/AcrR family transcriptional regulator [Planctomycetota bacterium]